MSTKKIDLKTVVRFDGDNLQKQISDATALSFDVPEGHTAYHPSRSMTQQQFADETDINNIMAQYEKNGLFDHDREAALAPRYGDTTLLPEFQEGMNIIAQATADFASLPAAVRRRFHNSPEEFVEFLSEPGHDAELRELGLLNPVPQEAPGDGSAASPEGDSSAAPSVPKGARKAASAAEKTPSE